MVTRMQTGENKLPTMSGTPIKDANSSFVPPEQTCKRLTLPKIQLETHNFDQSLVIGSGGFGDVYKCQIKIGSVRREVAVKRLRSISDQGASQFEAEVKFHSKLHHSNLVSLVGYCSEEKEMLLAYEFMPNGTLKDHLGKADSDLSWSQRLNICVGAARGLDYLHTGTSTQEGIIHRDIKTSNILLDANFAAKISDFGLAKVCKIDQTRTDVNTNAKGTIGYMDPCYLTTGLLTRSSDVYSFGIVLFEVLSGGRAVGLTLRQIKKKKLDQFIDPRLMGQTSKKCFKEFASIAGHCLHAEQSKRPTMADVMIKLRFLLSQERKNATSTIGGGLIDMVRSFLTGKLNKIADGATSVAPVHQLRIKSATRDVCNPR